MDLWVVIFVRETATNWTLAQAEDRLDLLESLVADVVNDNRATANWAFIGHGGQSIIEPVVDVSGNAYLAETIPLRAEVFG
jgi:hypothetical protein